MSLRHLKAIIRKEIQHIIRDRSTFVLVLLTPITMLFVFAYALTVDIEHVPIAVLDHDRSSTSRAFIQRVTEGKDLDLYARVSTLEEVNSLLMHARIKAALVIKPSFEHDLLSLRGMPMQVVIDGTEPKSGTFAARQISGRAEAFASELLTQQMGSLSLDSLQPIDLHVRALYNSGLKPRVDMVPGLISMMLGFPALSVALTLAHEREHGTLEQVLVTPAALALSFLVIFFPLACMPAEVRMEAMSLPRTHYAIITRGVLLTRIGLDVLWPNVLALLGMGIAFTGVAALFFRKKLG